ncbi:MAG: hypothetical protein WKG07_09455 [Hymenobacter sp.]
MKALPALLGMPALPGATSGGLTAPSAAAPGAATAWPPPFTWCSWRALSRQRGRVGRLAWLLVAAAKLPRWFVAPNPPPCPPYKAHNPPLHFSRFSRMDVNNNNLNGHRAARASD